MTTINDKRLEFPQIVVGDSVTLRQQLVGRIPTRRQYLQEIRRPLGQWRWRQADRPGAGDPQRCADGDGETPPAGEEER
jgi:hypothetical protein